MTSTEADFNDAMHDDYEIVEENDGFDFKDEYLEEDYHERSSEHYSSSDNDESDTSSTGNPESEESEDDINDDPYNAGGADSGHYEVGDDELFEVHDFLTDEGAQTPKKSLRMIILLLSTVLALLMVNLGYQLYQLSKVTLSDGLNGEIGSIIQSKSDNNIERDAEENNLHDDGGYQMPQYPTRIYTHTSLSSKNYRGGGILSDEMLHRFEEDGVIVIRNLVSPKLLERLDLASQMLIDSQDAGNTKKKRGKQFHMVKNGAIFMGVPPPKTCVSSAENEGEMCDAQIGIVDDDDNIILSSFRDLAIYSKIPRVAASLLRLDELRVGGEENLQHTRRRRQKKDMEQHQGVQDGGGDVNVDDSINLRICRDIFLTKDDDDYACGWHVDDTGFWPSIASDPGVNAWVALDDMPWPWSWDESEGARPDFTARPSSQVGKDTPVATFTLSFGSHRMPWRHQAYQVTGSTHTLPPEGYRSAADLIERRSGNGTCNIQTSAPDLYQKLEKNKVVFDLRKGDVIFHDRWVFHRTVTVNEYEKTVRKNSAKEQDEDNRKMQETSQHSKIFRRYSIRYAPGTAIVPPGYGVELSVLHDKDNANRTLDEIVERSGPWYPKVNIIHSRLPLFVKKHLEPSQYSFHLYFYPVKVWPHVLKRKPLQTLGEPDENEPDEEIEGITELVHNKMPKAEELQKDRKKEIQQLLSLRGGH